MLRPRSPQRCDRVREWISLELDGELSRFERVLVDRHVDSCEGCAAFSADVRAFTGALRTAPVEELERPVALPVRRRAPLRSLQVAAATLAVAAVAVGSLASSLREQPRTFRPSPSRAIAVDEAKELLRERQFRVLEERIALTQPRPVGAQPV